MLTARVPVFEDVFVTYASRKKTFSAPFNTLSLKGKFYLTHAVKEYGMEQRYCTAVSYIYS